MKAGLLFTGSGPIIFLTSYENFQNEDLISKFKAKGINKFIAYELPFDEAKKRYAGHFDIVIQDLHENDDLRILDYDGSRAFKMFSFKELGEPFFHE